MGRATLPAGNGLGIAAVTLAASLALSCAKLPPKEVPSDRGQAAFITQEQIAESGARNAWEAIRRNVNHLRFTEDTSGDPIWVGAVRGNHSLVAPDRVLFVLDGTTMHDATYLQEIPARTVAYIEILSGLQGTARFGMAGGNGVVVVHTYSPKRGIARGG